MGDPDDPLQQQIEELGHVRVVNLGVPGAAAPSLGYLDFGDPLQGSNPPGNGPSGFWLLEISGMLVLERQLGGASGHGHLNQAEAVDRARRRVLEGEHQGVSQDGLVVPDGLVVHFEIVAIEIPQFALVDVDHVTHAERFSKKTFVARSGPGAGRVFECSRIQRGQEPAKRPLLRSSRGPCSPPRARC